VIPPTALSLISEEESDNERFDLVSTFFGTGGGLRAGGFVVGVGGLYGGGVNEAVFAEISPLDSYLIDV